MKENKFDMAIEAITDESKNIKTVRIKRAGLLGKLGFHRNKTIALSELKTATAYRVTNQLDKVFTVDLASMQGDNGAIQGILYKAINESYIDLIEALAIAIHNDKGTPKEWIYEALEYHFTIEELATLTSEVYRRLDVTSFFVILELVRGVKLMNILER